MSKRRRLCLYTGFRLGNLKGIDPLADQGELAWLNDNRFYINKMEGLVLD
jgi:hypothetical protein